MNCNRVNERGFIKSCLRNNLNSTAHLSLVVILDMRAECSITLTSLALFKDDMAKAVQHMNYLRKVLRFFSVNSFRNVITVVQSDSD